MISVDIPASLIPSLHLLAACCLATSDAANVVISGRTVSAMVNIGVCHRRYVTVPFKVEAGHEQASAFGRGTVGLILDNITTHLLIFPRHW